jgi:hypothetical protein
MESRFGKYKSVGKVVSDHIANINNFIDWNFDKGLDLIEKEINDLQGRINAGNAPAIFSNKVNQLINLGECIEKLHETYHYSKNQAQA